MSDPDLGKAYTAGRDEIAGYPIGSGYYSTSVAVDEADDMARLAIHAALPDILDAYAAKAEAEGDAAYVAWQHAELGTGGPDYGAQKASEDAYGAAVWLRAEAARLRESTRG